MDANQAILLVSMLLAVAWSPIAIFFWRAWRARGAPLSLAITILALVPVYSNIMSFFFVQNDPIWIVVSLIFVNAFVLVVFGVCFRLQQVAFPDARDAPLPSDRKRAKKGTARPSPRARPKKG